VQSGKFTLNPNETKPLSELSVPMTDKDAVKTFLYIKEEITGRLLAKDSLEINKNQKENLSKKIEKTEKHLFALRGITIDETKTKIGREFYDLFYMDYNNWQEKFERTITINEIPARATTTQINILLDDRTIYSFFSNPNEEILKEQVSITLKILRDLFQKKDLLQNEFKY